VVASRGLRFSSRGRNTWS